MRTRIYCQKIAEFSFLGGMKLMNTKHNSGEGESLFTNATQLNKWLWSEEVFLTTLVDSFTFFCVLNSSMTKVVMITLHIFFSLATPYYRCNLH